MTKVKLVDLATALAITAALQQRDLIWTAGAAASSDARYGKLTLDSLQARRIDQAGEETISVVDAISPAMETIRGTPDDELIALVDSMNEDPQPDG